MDGNSSFLTFMQNTTWVSERSGLTLCAGFDLPFSVWLDIYRHTTEWYLAAQQRLQRLVEGTFAEEEEGTGGGGDDAHGRGRGDGGDRGEANNDVIFEGSVLEEDVSKEDDD